MKLHIKNARLIDPAQGIDAVRDVFIGAGKVVALGAAPEGFAANRVVDAQGLWLIPGLVDLSARLREPGFEYKATLESEIQAALSGGVTSLICPPDTDPVLDEPGLVEMLKQRARTLSQTHVYPLGALTVGLKGEILTEMAQLSEAGCIGFSQAEEPVVDTNVLMRALQYAATFGYSVWLRPQDAFLARGGVAHSGPVATRLGLPGIPSAAETVALHTIFELVRATGTRVHLCRVSTADGLALVRAAKLEGLPISCDVAIHHVHLIDNDIGYFDSNCRVNPPLRSARDRDAIRTALADGTIDAICSDHTPVDDDAKQLPFGEAEPGTTGLELLLSLVLKWGSQARIDPLTSLAKITSQPAALAGLACGTLLPGFAADLCLVDPAAQWQVDAQNLKSQGKNTPFLGYPMDARVVMTMVDGHIAYEALSSPQPR
jgi:dihydroorotase